MSGPLQVWGFNGGEPLVKVSSPQVPLEKSNILKIQRKIYSEKSPAGELAFREMSFREWAFREASYHQILK